MKVYTSTMFAGVLTLGTLPGAAVAACPTQLNPPSLNQMLANGQLAFQLDDEGFATQSIYLELDPASLNANNGRFTGYLTPQFPPSQSTKTIAVTGTLAPVGNSGMAITFSYSTGTTAANGTTYLGGTTYSYTGAIAMFSGSCTLFLAGTYMTTALLPSPKPPGIQEVKGGPYPFSSGKFGLWIN